MKRTFLTLSIASTIALAGGAYAEHTSTISKPITEEQALTHPKAEANFFLSAKKVIIEEIGNNLYQATMYEPNSKISAMNDSKDEKSNIKLIKFAEAWNQNSPDSFANVNPMGSLTIWPDCIVAKILDFQYQKNEDRVTLKFSLVTDASTGKLSSLPESIVLNKLYSNNHIILFIDGIGW